jgi:DNA-binding winged helix-turn-helix (wHTH) protein
VRYVFGSFALDTETRTLARDGRSIAVQPKVFQLLGYLLLHRARYVTKEELLATLWAGEHVTDSSLYVSIRSARAALGQHGDGTPISMLRGAGYRFVADVVEQLPAPAHAPEFTARAIDADPFVGREHVLLALSKALDDGVRGRGRLVILSGEPGIGKTRCARELALRAETRGVPVLTARCLEDEGAPALWPFIQLLRQIAAQNADAAQRIEPLLTRLLPPDSLGDVAALSGTPAERTIERFRTFDRVARALHEAAEAQALVLVLDDLQWADDASLRQLELCVTDLEYARILIIATLRAPQPNGDPARQRLLRRLERAATVIELGRLSRAETEELVRQLTGANSTAKLSIELHRKTEGNPFFLRELLRTLPAAALGADGDETLIARLPGVVRDMVLARLDDLDDSARSVLRAASTLGKEVELATLRAVVQLPAEGFLLALETLLERGLLTRSAEVERCSFSHDLVREVIYGQLEEATRVRCHRRIAEVLEARGDRSPVEIAYHFHRALPDGVHKQVLRYATLAGAASMETLAFETAERCYRWALSALDFDATADPRIRAQLMLELGVAILAGGRSAEAAQVLRDAAQVADRGDYGDLLAHAGTWLRHNVALAPLPDRFALRLLERARTLLGSDQPALRAQVLSRLAWIWPHCKDMRRCKALADEALALARETGNRTAQLDALTAMLYARSGPDDGAALLATAEEIFALERKTGQIGWAGGQAQFMRYHALLQMGERDVADRALAELTAVAARLKLRETILMCDRLKAQQAFHAGRFDDAAAQFADQHGRGQRCGLVYADLYYVLQRLNLQWEREGLRELPVPSNDGWDITQTALFRATRVFVAASSGSTSKELDDEFEQLARADFTAVPRDINYLVAMCLLAQVTVARKDVPRALTLYGALKPYGAYTTISLISQTAGAVAHYLGELAQLLGQPAQAARYFEDALTINESMGYATWAVRTKVAHAELLAREPSLDGAARARQLLLESQSAARVLGLGPLTKRIAELLAS